MSKGVGKIQDLSNASTHRPTRYGGVLVYNKYPTSSGPSAGPSPPLERKTPVGKDPLGDDNEQES